jgi:hypothetical protein
MILHARARLVGLAQRDHTAARRQPSTEPFRAWARVIAGNATIGIADVRAYEGPARQGRPLVTRSRPTAWLYGRSVWRSQSVLRR